MIITGLRADSRLSGCVIVEVDGDRLGSLPVEVLRELALEIGLELTPGQQEQVMHASAVEAARRVALRILAARPRAVQDLKRRLRDRGHGPTAIDQVIQRLQAGGLLDDLEFARHFARVRSPRGLGPSRLIHDLLALGVERRVAEQGVRDIQEIESIDVGEAARVLAEKRVAQLAHIPAPKRRRRLLIYLARRGFQGSEIRKMVGQMIKN